MQHKDITQGNQHILHNWKVINIPARDLLAVTIADIDKVALVADTYYRLKSIAPSVWIEIGGATGAGSGDMTKAVYDTTDNGIVDNAELVNGLTVETAVPTGAVFTDTVYTHPTADGSLHVPATGTTNNGKVLTAGATAGAFTWEVVPSGVTDHTLLTNIGTNTHSQIDTALSRLVNTSGTNTGDEDVTSIKTKLGITTLSGSNTGDQDLSGYSATTHNHTGTYEPVITKNTGFNLNTGTTTGTLATGDHTHTGVYEPADATILKDADIGTTVQAYSANTTVQGNTFNGISQLVQTDGTGKLPAIDGSLLTNLPSGADATKLPLAGGDMTGTIRYVYQAMAANDIAVSTADIFSTTISGATTLTVSSIPASPKVAVFNLELTNGGSAVITWFTGVKWAGGTAPTLTAAGLDILQFYTRDGGTTWRGALISKDNK